LAHPFPRRDEFSFHDSRTTPTGLAPSLKLSHSSSLAHYYLRLIAELTGNFLAFVFDLTLLYAITFFASF
jgi:hypothetical protein